MAKFELELSVREKRRLMTILALLRSEYKQSLSAAERGEVDFESDELKEVLVTRTNGAVEILNHVLGQLNKQNPK